jgi:hypothetical protein
MDSFSSLGVNRSDTRRYREDLQRQLGNEDTILCKRFSETKYQVLSACGVASSAKARVWVPVN